MAAINALLLPVDKARYTPGNAAAGGDPDTPAPALLKLLQAPYSQGPNTSKTAGIFYRGAHCVFISAPLLLSLSGTELPPKEDLSGFKHNCGAMNTREKGRIAKAGHDLALVMG